MAAIKVQSLNDITEAYFKSLGFNGSGLKNVVKNIMQEYAGKLKDNDVIGSLDGILLEIIKKNFPDNKFPNEQKVAWFKVAFMLNDGAKRWGADVFSKDKFKSDIVEALNKSNLVNVPEYKISYMEVQKIETVAPLRFLDRLLHLFRKG